MPAVEIAYIMVVVTAIGTSGPAVTSGHDSFSWHRFPNAVVIAGSVLRCRSVRVGVGMTPANFDAVTWLRKTLKIYNAAKAATDRFMMLGEKTREEGKWIGII